MGAQAVRLSNVDIDNALKNKDFEVLFQPIFDLGNGALGRVEAFVRWRHPNLGLLPPGAFISFFESQGRMSELTRYVLANAISAYTSWRGPFAPGLSINLALSDLGDDAFASHLIKLLRDREFPADLVTLECPMPPVDMPLDVAAEHFKRLSDTGARLAIEVRGRANDLLRSLDPFPFDEIKTGGSAILRFARTVRGPGLSAIADLLDIANDANAAITAVGVEDQASLAALRGLGFTAAQGNHLGKVGDLKEFRPHRINEVRELLELEPLSADEIAALFRTQAPSPQAPEPSLFDDQDNEAETEDALIERLNQRVAQFDAPEPPEEKVKAAPAAPDSENKTSPAQTDNPAGEDPDAEKKAKAREKAKALVLAKRARARAARKAAAIERAKAKAVSKKTEQNEEASGENNPPRAMQERLNEAFRASDGEIIDVEPQDLQETTQADEAVRKQQADKAPDSSSPIIITQEDVAQSGIDAAATSSELAAGDTAQSETDFERQEAVTASAAGHSRRVRLNVGASHAYFQPGIRVGAPALPGAPNDPIAPAPLNVTATKDAPGDTPVRQEQTPPDEAHDAKPDETPLSTVERAMAALEPDESPFQKAASEEPSLAPVSPLEDDTLGDLHGEENDAIAAAPRRRRGPRRKNFLTRKYQVWPTHFWPKSWKRAIRRRRAGQAARRANTNSLAAE